MEAKTVLTARAARRELWLIGLTSLLGLAFLVACFGESTWLIGGFALGFGLSFGLLAWAEPQGFERLLSPSKIRSVADWRVRELGAAAGARVEPWIWARRVAYGALLAALIVPDVFSFLLYSPP